MRELVFLLLHITISIVTGIVGHFVEETVWQIFQLVLLENILLLLIQVHLKQQDEDSDFAKPLSQIRKDSELRKLTAELLNTIASSRRHSNQFFTLQLKTFISEAKRTIESINNGVLKIDLRPGGLLLREAEAADIAKNTFWATSYVNSSYWEGQMGDRLLARSQKRVNNNAYVSRIFIEDKDKIPSIQNLIAKNNKVGVDTKCVEASLLDSRQRRDFAIIDGGTLAVELILNNLREPIEVNYYSPDAELGQKEISELLRIWNQLDDCAK
jgi:hypothetical protein